MDYRRLAYDDLSGQQRNALTLDAAIIFSDEIGAEMERLSELEDTALQALGDAEDIRITAQGREAVIAAKQGVNRARTLCKRIATRLRVIRLHQSRVQTRIKTLLP